MRARRILPPLRWSLLLFVPLLQACASLGAGDAPAREMGAESRSLVLEVDNGYFYDVRVYLVRGSSRIPLGVVTSADRRRFRVGPAVLGRSDVVRLLADPLGPRATYTSEPVPVPAGEVLVWRLAHDLKYSTLGVG